MHKSIEPILLTAAFIGIAIVASLDRNLPSKEPVTQKINKIVVEKEADEPEQKKPDSADRFLASLKEDK